MLCCICPDSETKEFSLVADPVILSLDLISADDGEYYTTSPARQMSAACSSLEPCSPLANRLEHFFATVSTSKPRNFVVIETRDVTGRYVTPSQVTN